MRHREIIETGAAEAVTSAAPSRPRPDTYVSKPAKHSRRENSETSARQQTPPVAPSKPPGGQT